MPDVTDSTPDQPRSSSSPPPLWRKLLPKRCACNASDDEIRNVAKSSCAGTATLVILIVLVICLHLVLAALVNEEEESDNNEPKAEDIALILCFPGLICAIVGLVQLERILRDSADLLDDPKATPKEFCTYEEWCKGGDGTGTCPKGEACAICLSEFTERDDVRGLLVCGHVFHTSCIDGWFRMQEREQFKQEKFAPAVKWCPLCRAPVVSAWQFQAQVKMQTRNQSQSAWRPGRTEPNASAEPSANPEANTSPEAMQEEGRATEELTVAA
jgi:hypothetical protein